MRRSPGRAITASSLSPNIRWFVPFSIAPALPPLWSEVGCVASSSFSAILKGNNNEHNYNGQAPIFAFLFLFVFPCAPPGANKEYRFLVVPPAPPAGGEIKTFGHRGQNSRALARTSTAETHRCSVQSAGRKCEGWWRREGNYRTKVSA